MLHGPSVARDTACHEPRRESRNRAEQWSIAGFMAPPRHEHADVHHAREARDRIVPFSEQARIQIDRLQAAREMVTPSIMRAQANELERLRVLLMINRDLIHRGIAHSPADAMGLRHAAEVANDLVDETGPMIARARQQAAQLEGVERGALKDLPRAPSPWSPTETRKQASELAPTGICDDPSMQDYQSPACPLDSAQREAVRELVRDRIEDVATNWRTALQDAKLEKRLKSLVQSQGISPLIQILVSVVTSYLTGMAGTALVAGVNAARGAMATGNVGAAFETVSLGPLAGAPTSSVSKLGQSSEALIKGFGSKLAERALSAGSIVTRETSGLLFIGLNNVVTEWSALALSDVRQLPDPALVALGKAMKSSPFTIQYFHGKVTEMLERYDVVDKIGKKTSLSEEPMQPVWVVDPRGEMRMALAREQTTEVDGVNGGSLSFQQDVYARPNGRFAFEGWVDNSLVAVAHARWPKPMTMTMTDARWVAPPTAARDDANLNMLSTGTEVATR